MYPHSKVKANQPCSRSCVHNWTNFKQKPPQWQHCKCNPLKINLKSKILIN